MKICYRFGIGAVLALWLFALAAPAATLTVISIADSGPGSLRQAIAVANPGDVIVFDPILLTKKIALTSGELVINKNLTITGLGTGNFAVAGTSTTRVFTVTGGANATLSAFTISDGTATNGGGGIANFATLTLNNILFTNNTAVQGGAIFTSNGILKVVNSTLRANGADDGGAIYVAAGSATITGSVLTTNSATTGGAIANHGSLTLNGTTLGGNLATFGGGLYSTNGAAALVNSTLTGNSASAGGAIYNDVGNTLSLTTSNLITGNLAFGGGGLYNEGTVSVGTSRIASNNAVFDGGGIYNTHVLTLTGATLADNAAERGAGLFTTNGTVTVTNTTFAGNSTGSGQGGAIYNDSDNTVALANSTLTGNAAAVGAGLANFGTAQIETSTFSNNLALAGGGLYSSNATAIVSASLFTENTGGGIYNDAASRLTVVISTLAGNTGGALQNAGTLTLAENTLAGNSAGLNNTGAATLDNNLFAGNAGGNLAGAVTSKGFNLSDDNSGAAALTAAGDQNDTPAGLSLLGLQANGGPTLTIALAPDSAALAAGGPVYAPFEPLAGGGQPVYPPFTDQRGLPRFVCGKLDIGAFQTQTTTPPTIALLGPAVLTNECLTALVDPGAVAANTCGDALSVAAGGAHSLVLKNDGGVVGWGDNTSGQTSVPGNFTDPVAIAAGESHSLGLREDGAVLAWGNNANGQINVPATVTNALRIAAGGFHSLAIDEAGNVVGWGDDSFGQTNVPGSVLDAVAVAAGRYHSVALLGDGTVVGWGGGTFTAVPEDGVNYGQAEVPVGLSDIVAVAAGAYHSVALRNDGVVFAWGGGSTNLSPFVDFGQSLVPPDLSNVVAIAAGGFHSLALVADGRVVAWGNDDYGQSTVPALVQEAAAIAGGTYHSLAISRDGAVAGWGLNTQNQTIAPANLLLFDLSSQIAVATNGTPNQSGTATLTYTIVDGRGASNSVTRTIITTDTAPPVPNLAVLPAVTNECSVTLVAPTATDACAGPVTAVAVNGGNLAAIGTHNVEWVYTDPAGNSATQTQTVVIDRVSPPAILCVGNIATTNTPGQCGAIVHYNLPVVTPNCPSATLTRLSGLPSGALFPVGVTTNTFRVTDVDANFAECTFTVTVTDTQSPVIVCPSSPVIISTAPGACQSAPVTYPITVTDNCTNLNVVFNPPTGTVFPIGTTNVTCTATDASGNTNVCVFTLIIKDLAGPLVTCPGDSVVSASSVAGAAVTFPTLVATDSCSSASVVLSVPSGTVFPLGVTVVTATATDGVGNQTVCTFRVTVRSPRDLAQGVYNQAVGLGSHISGSANIKQFHKAVDSLYAMLTQSLWAGPTQVTASGKKVFSSAGKAIKTFQKLARNSETGIDEAQWQTLLDELTDSLRSLAVIKIAAATQAGGDAKRINAAEQSLARGDAFAAAGQADRAVKEYAKAWQSAVKASS